MLARRLALLLSLAVLALSACASSSPQLKVIGVGQAQSRGPGVSEGKMLVLFVEVVNATQRDLELFKLEYEVTTDAWFNSQGSVRLARDVDARGTAVVEIPVPYQARTANGAISYRFKGKLYAHDARVERSWKISQDGVLGEGEIAVRPISIETRIADGQ